MKRSIPQIATTLRFMANRFTPAQISAAMVMSLTMPAAAGEFFQPAPSSSSQLIYVSPQGSDSNPCTLSDPCRSLDHGLSLMRRGMPDHLYLERGGEWDLGEMSAREMPSGQPGSPAVLGYYGSAGPRPVLLTGGASWDKESVDYVVFNGWHFKGKERDPNASNFIHGDTPGIKFLWGSTSLTFDDVKFSFVELVIQNSGYEGYDDPFQDVIINRSMFVGAYDIETSYVNHARASNLYITGVNGLTIEDSVFDLGGWHPDVPGAGANQYSHCFYGQYSNPGNSVLVTNNIFSRCSSHGLQVRWGGLVENNFFARNAVAAALGYHASSSPTSPANTRHIFSNNVISETTSQYRGHDACQESSQCSNASWGVWTDATIAGTGSSFLVEDNLIGGYNYLADNGFIPSGSSFNQQPLNLDPDTVSQGNVVDEAIPTLADYSQYLGFSSSDAYDAFMTAALDRPVGVWDPQLQATAINSFIRNGGAVSNPNPAQELLVSGDFSAGSVVDMPTTLYASAQTLGSWYARLGTCGQCSTIASDSGVEYLQAGSGTSNGTVQLLEVPSAASVTLKVSYRGAPRIDLLTGSNGDSFGKYDDSTTFSQYYSEQLPTKSVWTNFEQVIDLSNLGSAEYLAIRVYRGEIDDISLSTEGPAGELITAGDFSGSNAVADMPTTLTLSNASSEVWYVRPGSCSQCSEPVTSGSTAPALKAGSGNSNGAFQVIPWPGAGDLNVAFDYEGTGKVRIYGAFASDTFNKYDGGNTATLLYEGSPSSDGQWASFTDTVSISGGYDYLVVQLIRASFDNISVQ